MDVGPGLERCQEHMVADGEIDRSVKEAGNVIRKRRCKRCGRLFVTHEMTVDAIAFKQAGVDNKEREFRVELAFYKRVVGEMGTVLMIGERIKNDIELGFDFKREDEE